MQRWGFALVLLFAPCVLAIQAIFGLKSGTWPAISLADALLWVNVLLSSPNEHGAFSAWLTAPKSWIGVHKILDFTPIAGAVAGFGFLLVLLSNFFDPPS